RVDMRLLSGLASQLESPPCTDRRCHSLSFAVFFIYHPATSDLYTLSLHDALPIYHQQLELVRSVRVHEARDDRVDTDRFSRASSSEEQTSELQSRAHLVCRLLLGKKNAAV